MPTNVVKTPRQEKLWEEAKASAEKQGKGKNYAYIMGIFKQMGGLKEASDAEFLTEKIAVSLSMMPGINAGGVAVLSKGVSKGIAKGITPGTFGQTVSQTKSGLASMPGLGTRSAASNIAGPSKAMKMPKPSKPSYGGTVVSKTAAYVRPGYLGRMFGTAIGKAKKGIDVAEEGIAKHKKSIDDAYDAAEKKPGLLGIEKLKDPKAFKAVKEHYEGKIGDLKNQVGEFKSDKKQAGKDAFGTRVKTLAGAGVVGGAGYAANNAIGGVQNYMHQQQKPADINYGNTAYASEINEEIEKMAKKILSRTSFGATLTPNGVVAAKKKKADYQNNGLEKVAIPQSLRALGRTIKQIPGATKDLATFKTFRETAHDLKALKQTGRRGFQGFNNPSIFSKLESDKINNSKMRKRLERAEEELSNLSPNEQNIESVWLHPNNPENVFGSDRRNQINELKNKIQYYKDALEAGEKVFGESADREVARRNNSLAASLALYGSIPAGVIGIKKLKESKET